MTKSIGIIGWPLGHTLSPTLHNWGFGQLGVDARYEAWPLEPADLPDFMRRFRTEPIHGASVTIPHKRAVMAFVDGLTDRASRVGAVNTLSWQDGRVLGDNTDVLGLMAPLAKLARVPGSALVLGAGGAARAAVAALTDLGIARVLVANRTRSKADELAGDFGVESVEWEKRTEAGPELVLNTTPLGMSGAMVDATPWPAEAFFPAMIAYDIVYNPLRTRFLQEAEAAGCTVIDGLSMFLHQGLAQFRIWTGLDLDEGAARQVLLAALG